MEEMLGQKMSPPICFRQFLANYKDVMLQAQQTYTVPQKRRDISTTMQKDKGIFAKIEANCSLKQLCSADDPKVTKFLPGMDEKLRKDVLRIQLPMPNLNTYKEIFNHKRSKPINPFRRSHHSYKMVQLPATQSSDRDFSNTKIQQCDLDAELIVTVRVYRPVRATHTGRSVAPPVFAEEFECLGSNLLTQLRDKISCICDKNRFFDISANPMATQPVKDTDPSYFFITDTFYNDTRNPLNPDYSATVREWAKQTKTLSTMQFQVASMEHTHFIDLTASLGFPQHYQHHGNCEHVFTFSQLAIYIPNSANAMPKEHYPRLRSFNLYNSRMCKMCGARNYDYIVEDSNRQLHNPANLCHKCFDSYHYIDGKKIGSFKAYRINDIQCKLNKAIGEGTPDEMAATTPFAIKKFDNVDWNLLNAEEVEKRDTVQESL